MGWDFTYGQTKKGLVEYLTKNSAWEYEGKKYSSTCFAHSVVGNHLWGVFDRIVDDAPAKRYLCLFLMANDRSMSSRFGSKNNWGYKDITEAMGPAYYDCPLYLLDMTPMRDSPYSQGWRDQVRAHHAKKRGWSSLKAGDTVKLAEWLRERYKQEIVTIEDGISRGRLYKAGVIAGTRYRLSAKCVDFS